MIQIKYVGNGLSSRGVKFDPKVNDGLYTIPEEDGKYLLETFPKQFKLIEKVSEVVEEQEEEKKPRTRKPRKKSTDIIE